MADGEYLSRKEASTFLHRMGCPITPHRLAMLAVKNNSGNGPPFKRFRWRQVRYHKDDLIQWANKETEYVK